MARKGWGEGAGRKYFFPVEMGWTSLVIFWGGEFRRRRGARRKIWNRRERRKRKGEVNHESDESDESGREQQGAEVAKRDEKEKRG